MALRGKGMLVVFTDVSARHERDFNEWYNREHIDERVNMPGFRRARRYVAVHGGPKYLATYECRRVADLATPGYLAVLADPTPWSKRVTARFTHFERLTLRLQIDLAQGIGGALTSVRFVPDPARKHALIDWLGKHALPHAIKQPGMLGAAVGENDLDVANAPLREKSMDHRPADAAQWVVFLEGADPAVTARAARALFKRASLRPFDAGPPVVATYRLLFGSHR